MMSQTHRTTLELLLICPECGHVFTWTGDDFEDWIKCEKCGNQDEAWFFWHSLNPPAIVTGGISGLVRYEVFSMGDHYTNDAPLLSPDRFIEQLMGRYSGPVHGGGPYLWIYREWFPQPDNPNNGHIEYTVVVREGLSGYAPWGDTLVPVQDSQVIKDRFEKIVKSLIVGVKAVRSLPKPANLYP
jgi:hypothetical protein